MCEDDYRMDCMRRLHAIVRDPLMDANALEQLTGDQFDCYNGYTINLQPNPSCGRSHCSPPPTNHRKQAKRVHGNESIPSYVASFF